MSKGHTSQKAQPARKERGVGLTILLALMLLHGIAAVYLGFTTLRNEYVGTSWVLPALLLLALANLVGLVGIWLWKKWGLTLYAITTLGQAGVHLVLTGTGLVVFYDLIPLLVLGYLINLHNRRRYFD